MKTVSKNLIIYTFSAKNRPVQRVHAGEKVLIQTEDAFGGQLGDTQESLSTLDWSRVDGATGPIYVEGAQPGDTLVVEILRITTARQGVIAVIPDNGLLSKKRFSPMIRAVEIRNGYVNFDRGRRLKAKPMIGTIGVATESEDIPSSSLGRHGGNLDTKEITAGTKIYFPVFTEGALFAAGDVHAVQADGELCVSAVEVMGEVLFRFDLIKGKQPQWPILETDKEYAVLSCGETLDDAGKHAAETTVVALMRENNWTFEQAYMFGSIAIDLRINQVVDPKKGVRAALSKEFISLDSYLN